MARIANKATKEGMFIRSQYLQFFREPHTIQEAADRFSVNYYTARQYVEDLQLRGMLRSVGKEGRRLKFQTLDAASAVPPIKLFTGQPMTINDFMLGNNLDANPITTRMGAFHKRFFKLLMRFVQEYQESPYDSNEKYDSDYRLELIRQIRETTAIHLNRVNEYVLELQMLMDSPLINDPQVIAEWVKKFNDEQKTNLWIKEEALDRRIEKGKK